MVSATMLAQLAVPAPALAQAQAAPTGSFFNRIATFEAHRNVPTGRNVGKKSVAEIVAVSPDGRMLAYTDGEQMGIGLVDITDPAAPATAPMAVPIAALRKDSLLATSAPALPPIC
jgi:hypothetical protein